MYVYIHIYIYIRIYDSLCVYRHSYMSIYISLNLHASILQISGSQGSLSNAYKKVPKARYGSDLKIRDYLKDLSYARNGCDSIHLYSKHL
jgi:hypothetical protein